MADAATLRPKLVASEMRTTILPLESATQTWKPCRTTPWSVGASYRRTARRVLSWRFRFNWYGRTVVFTLECY